MVVLWWRCGTCSGPVVVQWCCGGSVVVQWCCGGAVGVLWWYHGGTVVVLWWHHGGAVAVPWWYHDAAAVLFSLVKTFPTATSCHEQAGSLTGSDDTTAMHLAMSVQNFHRLPSAASAGLCARANTRPQVQVRTFMRACPSRTSPPVMQAPKGVRPHQECAAPAAKSPSVGGPV